MSRREPSMEEVRRHVRERRLPMLVARSAGGTWIILAGIVSFTAAKLAFESETPASWLIPFALLALLQLLLLVVLRRPMTSSRIESLLLADNIVACAVIAWGGVVSGKTYSAELFLLGLALCSAALIPWGPRKQAILVVAAFLATQGNAFGVTGDFLSGMGFRTLIPVLVLLGTSIYTAHTLERNRLEIGREELRILGAEEEIRKLNRQLEGRVAERTADLHAVSRELETFSYSVAHDLRSPLRSMDGFAAAVLEECEGSLEEKHKDFLRRIRGSAQRLGNLVDDLLALSQVARFKVVRKPLDLGELWRSAFAELARSAPQRTVEVKIDDGLIVDADRVLVRLLVEQLSDNAWKFTRESPRGEIHCGKMADGDRVVYFVRDNGIGFDMAYMHKIFKVFEKLHGDRGFEGTGVGLAIVRQAIERHGGRVWAESEPGKGSALYFTLDGQGSGNGSAA